MPLTDVICRNAKPKLKPYKVSDGSGLFLLVSTNGSKLWRMKYRVLGKEKLLSIGSYPSISLAMARVEREKARKLLAEGNDPSLAKQEARRVAQSNSDFSFMRVARDWHEKQQGAWGKKHAELVWRRLNLDMFPLLGKMPISEITTPRIALVIEKIEKRGAGEVARRCLQYARAIFAYAKIKGLMDHNPADIKASDFLGSYERSHFAAMEGKDLPLFLNKLYSNEARLFRPTQIAMELLMLTFVRTSELIEAKWSEFDLEKRTWVIPPSRMKMKREHLVPLSSQAVRLLEELGSHSSSNGYIFRSQRDPKNHMSNNAILAALRRMGYSGLHTGHGFRALATGTLMEELGYDYRVIDVQLAHAKKSDVEAAYNRAKFIGERKKMMQDWSDFVDTVRKTGSLPLQNDGVS